MSRRGLALCFAAALALAALLLLPLRLALGWLDPDARHLVAAEVTGTVWRGSLRKAYWRGQPLGHVALGLQPLSLVSGVRRVRLTSETLSIDLLQGRVRGLEDGDGELVLERLDGLPGLSLRISLQDAAMTFNGARCSRAGGVVRAELRLPTPLPELPLTGQPSCQQHAGAGRLILVPDGTVAAVPVTIEATLEIEADGRYRLQSLARTEDPATRLALQVAGFQDSPSGLSRIDSGSLDD